MEALKEMFPLMEEEEIGRTLRECGGVVDKAVERLLRDRRDEEHVLPRGFLRWPKETEWEAVDRERENEWWMGKDERDQEMIMSDGGESKLEPVEREEKIKLNGTKHHRKHGDYDKMEM